MIHPPSDSGVVVKRKVVQHGPSIPQVSCFMVNIEWTLLWYSALMTGGAGVLMGKFIWSWIS